MSEEAEQMRSQLDRLGLDTTGLARVMQACGDDRNVHSAWRDIHRMLNGHTKVSAKMKVILTLLANVPRDELQAIAADATRGTAPNDKVVRKHWNLGILKVRYERTIEE